MIGNKIRSTNSKKSIITLFTSFLIVTAVLFSGMALFILAPKINSTFDDVYNKSVKITTKVLARQLEQYIYARELALKDIASHSLIINTSLLDEGDNPTFRDFIRSSALLGEDPELTVIDIIGEVLYTESDSHFSKGDYEWVKALISDKIIDNGNNVLIRIAHTSPARFEIAVPIFYGRRAQGVLVANIEAEPEVIFKVEGKFEPNTAVIYQKSGKKITSDINLLNVSDKESTSISRYDLKFSYFDNYSSILTDKTEILHSFILASLIGISTILVILYIFGRKLIVRPFQELAESQQSIESAVEGISRIDTNGCYVKLNQSYAHAIGYAPEELEGKSWKKTVFSKDLPLLEDAYRDMLSDGKVVVEARGLKKNGDIFYKRVTMVSRYDEKHNFVGHDCFMQDISVQKAHEAMLLRQKKELELIFDNVPVKIWYKNDENHILRLNKEAAKAMGGTVEDFQGKDTYDLFPSMAKKYHEDDLAVMKSNIPKLNIIERFTPAEGPHGWVSTNKVPYTDPVTNKSFIFVCAQDITALKEAEILQNDLVAKLTHTNAELEQFAYIASHDLKSPLRGIEQLAGWIQQDCEELLPDSSKKHLGLMVSRVKRMNGLLQDLLEFSRVNRIDLSNEPTDIKQVLEDLCDLHIEPFNFKYVLDVPDGNVLIARKPFEIIIRNLLDNAVKHHHLDKGNVTIRYDSSPQAHIIEVSDDGPGISPNLHEKAFTMFQTLQPRDKVEGSGMGLAIIRKIIHRYNGSINIFSDGENGTTFKVIWPYSQNYEETTS